MLAKQLQIAYKLGPWSEENQLNPCFDQWY